MLNSCPEDLTVQSCWVWIWRLFRGFMGKGQLCPSVDVQNWRRQLFWNWGNTPIIHRHHYAERLRGMVDVDTKCIDCESFENGWVARELRGTLSKALDTCALYNCHFSWSFLVCTCLRVKLCPNTFFIQEWHASYVRIVGCVSPLYHTRA